MAGTAAAGDENVNNTTTAEETAAVEARCRHDFSLAAFKSSMP